MDNLNAVDAAELVFPRLLSLIETHSVGDTIERKD
jgi:hypothetical protein